MKTLEHGCVRALRDGGYPDISEGLHSLRVGGATAYANAQEGGEMIATEMGAWESEAGRAYLYACEGRMHNADRAIRRQLRTEVGRGVRCLDEKQSSSST